MKRGMVALPFGSAIFPAFKRVDFVDENIAAVRGANESFAVGGISGDDHHLVGSLKTVAVSVLPCAMLDRECDHADPVVAINLTWPHVVRVHDVGAGNRRFQTVQTYVHILFPRLKDMP